jgi:MFS family permease
VAQNDRAHLDPSPFAFGIVIGARACLPFLLSIHGGVLMDRLGARRVMVVFAAAGLVVPVLFPLLPWVWAAAFLNLLMGMISTMNWVGAQTLVGQMIRGDSALTWRVTFGNRFGHFICPLLVGIGWDAFGPWGGFGVTIVWAVAFMAVALMLPRSGGTPAEADPSAERLRIRDILPRYRDYANAFALLGIPLVAVVAAGSVLNISAGAIQVSFFIAYMKDIGLTGTLIGIIFAGMNLSGLAGTAAVTPMARKFGDVRLLNGTVVAALAAITITPMLGAFVPLLVVSILRGYVQGAGQPLMIMIPSKMVPSGSQGAAVGLRISLNRLVQTTLPPLMGGVVSLVGLEMSFYLIGGGLCVLSCILWALVRPPARTPEQPPIRDP